MAIKCNLCGNSFVTYYKESIKCDICNGLSTTGEVNFVRIYDAGSESPGIIASGYRINRGK